MNAKTKETISRWVLVVATFVSFLAALGLILYPNFPLRMYLFEQGILAATIGLLGILSASFIAAIALLYVNKQTQTYSWRRDQKLKDIETIYEPLYQEVSKMERDTGNLDIFDRDFFDSDYIPNCWKPIKDSFLGTKLKLMDKELYSKLEKLFGNVKEYVDKRSIIMDIIEEVKKEAINPYISQELQAETIENILESMQSHLYYYKELFGIFLMGKLNSDWYSLKQKGEDKAIITYILQNVENKGWWKYQQFTYKQIEEILGEVYQKLQDNTQIRQIVDWVKNLNNSAIELRKTLENRILEPQLP